MLGVITNRLILFSIFFIIYTINNLLILVRFNNIMTHSYSYSIRYLSLIIYLLVLLLNLGSFPPIPGFFAKFFIFFSCIDIYRNFCNFLLLIILLNVLIIVSYVSVYFKYIVNSFSNSSNLLIY